MKKIYILTAVFALLTLSLNAQTKAEKKKVVHQQESLTEKVVTPPDGYFRTGPSRASTVTTFPYSNGFDSNDDWNWWTVIDANSDNFTWVLDNQQAVYNYNSSNTSISANDWLITAPIHLVAGKTYKFYIDAKSRTTTWVERLEVKLASTNTAAALSAGVDVIPAQDLNFTEFETLKNENVTVSTTGDYYFGIHAISGANKWTLYVDDLLIDVEADPEHDLAVSNLSAPTTAGAGSTITVTATVSNTGDYAENNYTVIFSDGTNDFSTQQGTSLAIGGSTTFTANYPTNANAGGQTVTFTATVSCANDANATNNIATASTSLLTLPPPENVQATGGELSGTMTWAVPNIASVPRTDTWDFESSSQANDWTLIDADGDGYNWEYNTYSSSATEVWLPHSGSSYMTSASYINDVGSLNPNNWMISPEVTLGGTLTFYASGTHSTDYEEKIGVYVYQGSYSGGTSGFVQVGSDITTTSSWAPYTFDLSQYSGTGRIAIVHHNCSNMYWLKVDDIEYQSYVPGEQPISYNVYLDGQLIDNVSSSTFSYNFNNVSAGQHQCQVSAVYAGPIESARVPATFTATSPDPELTAPENGSTVNVGTNYGLGVSTTINVSGNYLTQDLTVSVDNSDFSVSPTSISAADAMAGTTITVTYTGTDPNATGMLTIGSGEVSTTVNLTASYVYMAPVLTSPTDGSYLNIEVNQGSSTSQTITVSGEYLTEGLTVSVTGDGFSVSPTTISAADANNGTVTVTVTYDGTKPISSGTLTIGSSEVSATVNLIASTPGGSTNLDTDGIIRMGNLIIVDQFNESTAKNDHPKTYKYVLKYAPNTPNEKSSSPVEVGVEQTNSIVYGYYTADDVKNDSAVYNTVIVNRLSADVEMNLPDNDKEIYYVRLQSKKDGVPQAADKVKDNFDMLAKLQLISGDGGFYYSDALPESHPQSDPGEYHYTDKSEDFGTYAVDYKTYVPSIMTYGFDRHYFADDTLHNTYGAPIWKTGVGDVYMHSAIVERQVAQYASANWQAPAPVAGHPDQVDPNNTVPASMVLLHNVQADGFLPSLSVANVEYEPYKFHVYVYSKNGKLRGYLERAAGQDGMSGTHLINDPDFTNYTGPICIYSKDVSGETAVDITHPSGSTGKGVILNIPKKVQGSTDWKGYPVFGAVDSAIPNGNEQSSSTIDPDDLQIFVRFYYRSKGNELPLEITRAMRDDDESETPMYYGAEGAYTPDGWTALYEVVGNAEVVDQIYYNPQGMQSDRPFDGVNIVVTRYSDGTTKTSKMIMK